MKKIRVWVATRKIGSKCETTFEIEDDATEDEITEVAQEAMWDMIEWDWVDVDG